MKKLLVAMLVALLMLGCGEPPPEEAEWSRVEQEEEEAKRIAKSIGWHDYKIIAEAIDWIELRANFTLNGHFGKYYAPNQQTPYTGWVKQMHDNGQIVWLTQFKDGKNYGLWIFYNDENGQKEWESTYKNGKVVRD